MTEARIRDALEDKADTLKCCVTEVQEQCAEWAASPRFMNDDAQQMLADILDNILPDYWMKARRQEDDAPQQARDTVAEMKREMRE